MTFPPSKHKAAFQSILLTMVIALLPFGADIQAQFTVTYQATDITCFGANNGCAALTITGGCTPYSIEWSNSGGIIGTGLIQCGLYPGNTTVIIEDACGQVLTEDITIVEPEILIAFFTDTGDASCFGVCDATVELQILGGTAPFNGSYPDGAIVSPDGLSMSGLCAGLLILPITDANGCSTSAAAFLEEAEQSSDPNNLVINAPIVASDQYVAQSWIQSNAVILPGLNIDFTAGDYIDLKPNFHTFSGTNFHAFIEGCP